MSLGKVSRSYQQNLADVNSNRNVYTCFPGTLSPTDVKAQGMFFLMGWRVSSLHKGYTVEEFAKKLWTKVLTKRLTRSRRWIEGYSLMRSDPSSTHRRCFTVLRGNIVAGPSPL